MSARTTHALILDGEGAAVELARSGSPVGLGLREFAGLSVLAKEGEGIEHDWWLGLLPNQRGQDSVSARESVGPEVVSP